MKWWKVGLGIAGVAGVVWVFRMIMTPAPGVRMEDQGREHVSFAQSEAFAYNSNPPTSGPHNAEWVRAGVYDKPQHDALLIHSLEHGYVIIGYNCTVHLTAISFQLSAFSKVFAHEDEGTPSGEVIPEATGSAVTDSNECQDLVKNLEELAKKKKLWKLIVVPRSQLDTTIALTAWTYIDKFDPPAGGFDAKRIETFIDYHRDRGPEKTME